MNQILRTVRCRLACGVIAAMASCNNGVGPVVVNVTLDEFSVTLSPTSAAAGRITFRATNAGGEVHELVVVKADQVPDALPTEANGSYLENGPGTELVDEIEDISAGESAELTLELEPGSYVLLCNIVEVEDDGEVESHYAMGMFAGFTVE